MEPHVDPPRKNLRHPTCELKIAIVTQVYNEGFFLPIWLTHYGSLFGYENLFIIDDGTTDNSTSDRRIKYLIRKKRTLLDQDDRALLISLFHEELLRFYDIVIYTDCDELIVVDPKLEISLVEYLRHIENQQTNVIGFDVLHRVAFEHTLNFDLALFEQRKFVRFEPLYCKPLISKTPIRWTPGFHSSNKIPMYDENLFLFHLRAVDFENTKKRIRLLNTIQLSVNALKKGHGFQLQLNEQEYLENIFIASDDPFCDAINEEPIEIFRNYIYNLCVEDGFCVEYSKPIVIPDRFKNAISLSDHNTNRVDHDATVFSPFSGSKIDRATIQMIFDDCIVKMIKQGRERSRNELCPCGSGKRYEHCHGSFGAS